MIGTTLAASLLELAIAAGYVSVGALVARRVHGRPALAAFACFWICVGVYGIVDGLWSLSVVLGVAGLDAGILALHAKIVAIVAGFGGLVGYLVFMYSGSRRALRLVAVAYALLFVFVEAVYAARGPVGQKTATWGAQLVYARANVEPYWTVMLACLFVPPMLAALGYLSLLRFVSERPIRRRMAWTSTGLVLFFASLMVGWKSGGWYWWGIVEKGLGAMVAAVMLPVSWEAQRGSASGDGSLALRARASAQAKAVALRQRMDDLV